MEGRLASGKPLVVIIEDAHWSDDESLELFLRLFGRLSTRPVLGVITSRPEPRVQRIASALPADIVRMAELDPDSAVTLITQRFVPGDDVGELARQIVARTGGYPFFIREVLESLRERGVVVEVEQPGGVRLLRWTQRSAPLGVPSSVESFLATRIDALPAAEKEVLLSAAVLGRSCRPDMLAHLVERPVDDELAALESRGLLIEREGRRTFANDMLMTVVYGLLPTEERVRLHQRAAAHIAEPAHYRSGQDDAVIARHLELAGDSEAAAERYLAAAAHAARVGGNGDALRLIGRALKRLPSRAHERRFQAHSQREEILRRLARKQDELSEIQAMIREAQALSDPAHETVAQARLTAYHLAAGDTAAAAAAAAEALECAREANSALAESEALRLRALLAQRLGKSTESLAVADSALELCDDSAAGLAQRARVLNIRGTTLWHMSRLEEAIESYAEALVIYRHVNRPREQAQMLNNMGNIFAALGEYEDALSHYKRSLKLDQRLGDRASTAVKLGNIGQTYADIGDLVRAERYLRRGLTLAEELGDIPACMDATISLGQVAQARGHASAAIDWFERGLEFAQQDENGYMQNRGRIYLAWAFLDAGRDPDEALELARATTEQAEIMPMPIGQIFGLAVQALALLAQGNPDEAADTSAQAVALQAEVPRPEGPEQILFVHGQVCEAAGRLSEAHAAYAQARRAIDATAAKLQTSELREMYLASKVPAGVYAALARLDA